MTPSPMRATRLQRVLRSRPRRRRPRQPPAEGLRLAGHRRGTQVHPEGGVCNPLSHATGVTAPPEGEPLAGRATPAYSPAALLILRPAVSGSRCWTIARNGIEGWYRCKRTPAQNQSRFWCWECAESLSHRTSGVRHGLYRAGYFARVCG